jgi:hypothetical protein
MVRGRLREALDALPNAFVSGRDFADHIAHE